MKIKDYWPSLLWALVILMLTLSPSNKIPGPPDWNLELDKLAHLFIFFVLSLLFLLGPRLKGRAWSNNQLIWIALMMISYGLLLELLQILIPTRNFSWIDFVADAAGVVIGNFTFLGYLKLKSRLELGQNN